ncbi:putative thioredoxin [Pseudovirgaria hyperparasitica]|uniref:Putative thioredoxin n=1 Tax=Pseudovirgaria hyperparasitica TaxID=470096 RepID=A0A6A6W7N3_9PEZI|nr:putative thioredoxin [Pseudovirgaria hyperparasitica]KAF2757091.1 putative thioredoxin [Pseudovirgaria hyperparasitica]
MAKPVEISSGRQFSSLLDSSRVVVVDCDLVYADWCGPCKNVAPVYEQLAAQLSRPKIVTFAKVNVDNQTGIAETYEITAMPTFLVFKKGVEVSRVRGADPKALQDTIKKIAAEADSDSSGGFGGESSGTGNGGTWRGAELARGYSDVTEHVDTKGLDLLNRDSDFGEARVLFDLGKPSALDLDGAKGKGKATDTQKKTDWVESDTDEQLMLYIPFNMTMKIHTIQITSRPPRVPEGEDEDDELPMRPKTVRIYSNRAHNLGFDEADDITPTQEIELKQQDWNEETGTARLELRFVKFQNVTSLVVFIVDGDGESERVRLDRIRIIGETGEKREMGKLEKQGDDDS